MSDCNRDRVKLLIPLIHKYAFREQFLTLLCLIHALPGKSYAAEAALPHITSSAEVLLDSNAEPSILRGTFRFLKNTNTADVCFLLPSQISETVTQNRSLIQRLKAFDSSQPETKKTFRFQTLSSSKSIITGSILRFTKDRSQEITLSFETRLIQANHHEWLYTHAFPLPLQSCPDRIDARPSVAPAHFKASIASPAGWTLIGPNSRDLRPLLTLLEVDGRDLSFVLFRAGRYLSPSTSEDNLRVYSQQISKEFQVSLRQFFNFFNLMFGPLPSKSLILIESESLPLKNSPGLIIINKPRQKIFESLQKKYLNWEYWVLASKMAQQWYGNALKARTPEENWFIEGMSEFATAEALRKNPRRANIFNTWDRDFSYFEFSYSQFLNFSASWLFQKNTFADVEEQNDTVHFTDSVYVKHVLALKQLKYAMGPTKFDHFLRKFTQNNIHKEISPELFLSELRQASPKSRTGKNLASQLNTWWSAKEWAKLEMLRFDKTRIASNTWRTTVEFRKNTDLPIPLQIQGEDAKKQLFYLDSPANPEGVVLTDVLTNFEPKTLNLDPNHEFFELDRFENSSDSAGVEIIPGAGHTFSDQSYTVLWAPLALRNPGELSSFGVQIAVFKYLQSSINAKFEVIPTDSAGAYQVDYKKNIAKIHSKFRASTSLDYYGNQLSNAGLDKTVNIKKHSLTFTGMLNNKRIVGQPKTEHQSLLVGVKLDGFRIWTWTPTLFSSVEGSPGNHSDIPVYQRLIANPTLAFEPSSSFQLNLSVFVGRLFAKNLQSISPLFRVNDPAEAGLRIDESQLQRTAYIDAMSVEALTPLPIPWLGDSVVLLKKLRFKLFYDLGFTGRWDKESRLSAAGAGFLLPLGGDVMGAGTLVLSNFSVLGVFYTEALGAVSYQPRVLFNLSGNI